MSAGMTANVQAKTYFHGSMMDLNNGLFNVMWDPYNDNRNQGYNSCLMSQTMDGYPKEQMWQTILNQESIFKHQLQELHRLYKRQRDLMNEVRMKDRYGFTMPAKAPNSGHFLNQVCSQRRVIDLELPADVEDDNEENQPVKNVNDLTTKRGYNLADLNEPIQMEELSSAASFINKNSDYKQDLSTNSQFWYLQSAPKNANEQLSRKKTLFGVEIGESSHCSSDQITSLNHNHWIEPNRNKNLETQLPHWLTKTKGKGTVPYQMNLDSLQQHSEQFFKKSEKPQTVTKILGVIVQDSAVHHDTNPENDKNNHVSESIHVIDLNMSFNEEEEEDISATPNVSETVVNIASVDTEIEAHAETDDVLTDSDDHELVKSAAEAIMVISSSDSILRWFADVIESGDGIKNSVNVNKDKEDSIPEGMDYFEYMTLKLKETKVDNRCYKAVTVAENEEDGGSLIRKPVRKKRGRQRKDFQRDVLPGIVSLSRREVTEDLQTFEEAFSGIGVSWQSKRKGGRGRRQLVVAPPEESVCRAVVALEEKSLSGWGKRTRRLPRQRCQNGGGNHQSLALKC